MDLFEELGLSRYWNAEDTFTRNGASCMSQGICQAMREISQGWVDLFEVQEKVGAAIAKLTHNEGDYGSNGKENGAIGN